MDNGKKMFLHSILKKIENWTHTDIKYLIKGGTWLSVNQIVSFLSSFLLAIAFANLLPKEVYGTYRYILSIFSLLSIPTLAGINTALVRSVAQGYDSSILPALKTKIKWGLLGGLSSLILAGYYYYNHNLTLTVCFAIAGIFIPFMDSFLVFDSFLLGKKLFNKYSQYNTVITFFSAVVMVSTVFFTKNVYLIILSYFFVYTLLRLFALLVTIKKIDWNKKEDLEMIKYGKHLSAIDILSILADQLDKILIFHFLGASQLAIYAIAIAPVEQTKTLFKILQSLALPKFSQKTIEEIRDTIILKIKKLTILIAVVVGLYILMAPFIYKFFFPQYLNSIFYSQIYALSLFGSEALIIKTVLQSQKEIKKLYYINTTVPIVKAGCLIIFGFFFGVIGVVSSIIISRLFSFVLSAYYLKKMTAQNNKAD